MSTPETVKLVQTKEDLTGHALLDDHLMATEPSACFSKWITKKDGWILTQTHLFTQRKYEL